LPCAPARPPSSAKLPYLVLRDVTWSIRIINEMITETDETDRTRARERLYIIERVSKSESVKCKEDC